MKERDELHKCLHRLVEQKLLIPISNNKADQLYLKLGTGIESHHVPSLCAYTNVEWSQDKARDQGACLGFRHSSEEHGKPTPLAQLLEKHVPALVPRPKKRIATSEHYGQVRNTVGHSWQGTRKRSG